MALLQILGELKDIRKEGTDCDFNGYLEDYLDTLDDDSTIKYSLQAIHEKNSDMKICVNYRFAINKDVISNQIIRYKDSFKLQGKPIVCPYIIYGRDNDTERGLILLEDTDKAYLCAKGVYYCLTEPMSPFVDAKNEIVSMVATSSDEVLRIFDRLFTYKAGALQRELDRKIYPDYAQLKADALELAAKLRDNAETMINESQDPEDCIRGLVTTWFLLKKVVYVQYMVNKEFLEKIHESNIKKQRNQAKQNADEIPFMSYSDCWRSLRTEEVETSEE